MKKDFIYIPVIIFFLIMLVFPETVFLGAQSGLLLWFQIVLPTLLPFLILSSLLLHTPAIDFLVHTTSPLFCRIFQVSRYGSFAVLCGFLCGYPMGGKVTSDLLESRKITSSEARYLLSFCNNTSPMFIISYVMHQNLNAAHLIIPALCILFLSPVICSFIFRPFYRKSRQISYASNSSDSFAASKPGPDLMDECIMKSFETITKIGGYIILFSILFQLISSLPLDQGVLKHLFLPFLEITNGVLTISESLISFQDKFIITLALVSFGGWCSIAQTRCIISKSGIPLFPYIIEKLITSAVTSLLASVFFQLY